jgi:chaperonin cofactor prefoldin
LKESVHQEMVANVARLTKSMQVISESSICMEKKQGFEQDLLNMELALVELDPVVDEARHKLLSAR